MMKSEESDELTKQTRRIFNNYATAHRQSTVHAKISIDVRNVRPHPTLGCQFPSGKGLMGWQLASTRTYKKQGKRSGSDETVDYPIQTTNLQPPQTYQLRRELPKNLSEESILKEAALVLAQAERVKCKAEGGSDIVGGRLNEKSRGKIQRSPIPNQFHSLPSRKKNSKPITRSVSDASSKKPKKPSIFSIFSRKSDPHLDQIEQDRRFKEGGGRRLIRSKSDASPSRSRKFVHKRNSSENEDIVNTSKTTQLSPIIENTQKEDYFEGVLEGSKNVNTTDKKVSENKSKEDISRKTPEKTVVAGNIGYTSNEDLDLVPSKPVSDTVKETITSLATHSKSVEDMHSSQLPPEKPPLTKGLTVDGMVKRLSMERFSPPPPLTGPAFSYTRPNEQIIYAQVVCDSEGRPREDYPRSSREKEMDLSYKYQTNGFEQRSAMERSKFASQNKSEVYISENFDSPYRSYSPPQITRIRGSSSPQHWKHSPRNLSDEDEGLGFEPRKYFEEDLPTVPSSKRYYQSTEYERKSPSFEPPIVPVIRSVSPIEVRMDDRGKADGMDSRRKDTFNEFRNLSYRREALESKIRNRRFGSSDQFDTSKPGIRYRYSPERSKDFKQEFGEKSDEYKSDLRERYLSPERDTKFHKLDSKEILNRYSPDRTHLDMISPNKDLKTSRFVHTKCYDDGSGGVKEVYERETRVDEHGKPHMRESRRRERLDSPKPLRDSDATYRNGHVEDRYRQDIEPKSLDSQFSEMNRSSPDNVKRIDVTRKHEESWHDSLKRDKRQQRSFDKGDSGIENDFRKESFNGDLTTKWRKRTVEDDIKACELFIKKEIRDTEEQHPQRKKYDFVYRERSIDDGSHFDPRLDKYPKGTLRKKDAAQPAKYSSPSKDTEGTLKREKKMGGLEKVKKLFSSGRKKENKQVNGKGDPNKDRYMVKEEEMRSRYHEYRGVAADLRESNVPDISTRRRLSTPKASPLLKRTSSEKTSKPSPLSLKNEEPSKAEKSGWFKSLDRKAKKKYDGKLDSPFRTPATTEDEFSTIRSKKTYRTSIAPPLPEKNLRFFGDTDQESNPSVSRALSNARTRPSVSTLNRHQKYSQSAYHLDRITKPNGNKTAPRSNSLQNLGEGFDEVDRPKRRHHSRSRELDDISESASDAEDRKEIRYSNTPKIPPRDKIGSNHIKHRYEEHSVRRSHERESRTPQRESSDTTRIEFRKPPPGPPKPARSSERSHNYSRERDRLHDSSGTEGESSLQSQRSVVYLHATTIGAIPQPYQLNSRRRAVSREELRSKNKTQPMTKTVSRSVSMLAPWKPKHMHEGYEINYSQEVPEKNNKMSTMPRKSSNTNNKIKKTDTISRSRKNVSSKDDLSSMRNSSVTSASKSGVSSNQRTLEKKSSDLRKDTLNRRRVK